MPQPLAHYTTFVLQAEQQVSPHFLYRDSPILGNALGEAFVFFSQILKNWIFYWAYVRDFCFLQRQKPLLHSTMPSNSGPYKEGFCIGVYPGLELGIVRGLPSPHNFKPNSCVEFKRGYEDGFNTGYRIGIDAREAVDAESKLINDSTMSEPYQKGFIHGIYYGMNLGIVRGDTSYDRPPPHRFIENSRVEFEQGYIEGRDIGYRIGLNARKKAIHDWYWLGMALVPVFLISLADFLGISTWNPIFSLVKRIPPPPNTT
jgi:hypothetical protein